MVSFAKFGRPNNQARLRVHGKRRRRASIEPLETRVVLSVTATTGTLVSNASLVTFTDGGSPPAADTFTATIDWGDGGPTSLGTISLNAGTYTVTGSHNYAQPGSDTIQVAITGNSLQFTDTTTATVTNPTITPGPALTETTGTATGVLTLGTLSGTPTPDSTAYSATVNWGDGSPATAAAVASGAITTPGHTYGAPGTYDETVTLSDAQGFVVGSTTTTVTVTNPTITPGTALTETTGTATGPLTLGTISGTPTPDSTAYTATINWGDGSTSTAANISAGSITTPGHTYAQPGSYTETVDLTDAQGYLIGTSTIAVTVTNPTLTPAAALTETAGTATGALTVATLSGTPTPDSTAYTATINWGDGSTATAATISAGSVTTPGHTYGAVGSYTETVTLTDAQGYVVGTTSTAVTVDVLGVAINNFIAPAAGIATGPVTVATVATYFNVPSINPADYTALVNWGDGTTVSESVSSTGATGNDFFVPTGGHTYSQGGSYTLGVSIFDAQGYLVGSNSAVITVGVTLTGTRLTPQADSGISQNDAITNVDTPTFAGNVNPGTTVDIYATPVGSTASPGILVASGVGNGSGVYTATNYSTLADGLYGLTALAVNTSTGAVLATEAFGPLTVETLGPVVSSVAFNRFDATATITLTEPNGLDNLDYASITNSAFYHLSASPISSKVHVPKTILPTSITVTAGATPNTEVVSVVFYRGRPLRGGLFTLTVASGNNDNGVQDVAGNALDGNFYGTFPSGDGLPGGNFVALIPAFHKKILPAEPIVDGYVPPVNTPGTQPTSTLGAGGNIATARRAELLARAAQWPDYAGVPSVRVADVAAHKPAIHDLALKSLISDKSSGKS